MTLVTVVSYNRWRRREIEKQLIWEHTHKIAASRKSWLGFSDSNRHILKSITVRIYLIIWKEGETVFCKRKAATEAFVEIIDVGDILEFTAPPSYPTQWCYYFDVPECWSSVRPHLAAKATQEKLSLPIAWLLFVPNDFKFWWLLLLIASQLYHTMKEVKI